MGQVTSYETAGPFTGAFFFFFFFSLLLLLFLLRLRARIDDSYNAHNNSNNIKGSVMQFKRPRRTLMVLRASEL